MGVGNSIYLPCFLSIRADSHADQDSSDMTYACEELESPVYPSIAPRPVSRRTRSSSNPAAPQFDHSQVKVRA